MDTEDITDFFDDDIGILDWIYVEDDFPLADELAESQIPDPGYAGTNHEIAMEAYDFDLFDYWEDLQYGEDEYWEQEGSDASKEAGEKRKRGAANASIPASKRRKLHLLDTGGDNVYFVNWATRIRKAKELAPRADSKNTFALLPNWRTQFKGEGGFVPNKEMPAAMKQAAESKDEDTPPKHQKHFNAMAEDEEWEDEDEEGAGEDGGDLGIDLSSLDPDMLKSILKQKLGAAGLEGMNEDAFMSSIFKMLSGGEGAEDAAGDLANSLLGQATEGENTALSGWLSQQGVSLDAADEDDDTSSIATAELPLANGVSHLKKVQASPPDSAIEMLKNAETSEIAMHGSSPSASAKKRTAAALDETAQSASKRKKVTFDVPDVDVDGDSLLPTGIESTETQHFQSAKQGSEGDQALEINDDPVDEEIVVAQSKAQNKAAMQVNGTKTNVTGRGKKKPKPIEKMADVDPENIVQESSQEDTIAVAPAPTKNTRKRKAVGDCDEVGKAAPKAKKQARSNAPARTTRSTRAATKAGK